MLQQTETGALTKAIEAAGLSHGEAPGLAPRGCALCGEDIEYRNAKARWCSDTCCAEAKRIRHLLEGRSTEGGSLADMLRRSQVGAISKTVHAAGLERRK